jgi:hypothetical protein
MERGILSNAEMVRAILDGRKTQTRRPAKDMNGFHRDDYYSEAYWDGDIWTAVNDSGCKEICSPFGLVGDILYVREAFAVGVFGVIYRDDCGKKISDNCWKHRTLGSLIDVHKWTPSIHMPRWASRIDLRVKRVWVERVEDISEEDAKAEGVEYTKDGPLRWHVRFGGAWHNFMTAKGAFIALYESIYGPGNPWVWCCEFERVEK